MSDISTTGPESPVDSLAMPQDGVEMAAADSWDRSYETRAVSLLTLGLGLVGLDRFVLMPLFPVVAKDLGLGYQDLGLISGIIALTWGMSSVVSGRLSDKYGRRVILIPAVLIFSALAGLTGLAAGLASLLAIRALMGLFEGAYIPASIAATTEASHPSRIGRNVGLQQMAQPLFGLAIAPILATQLLDVVPSWRWIFVIVSVPGFILAWYMGRNLRDTNAKATPAMRGPSSTWLSVFRYRNVTMNIALMLCWLSSLVVLAALLPSYLTDHLGLGLKDMGLIMAANGLGSAAGMLILPAVSDRVGRKPVVLAAAFIETGLLLVFIQIGATPVTLASVLFVISLLSAGTVALTVGPLTTEAVPVALTSTAIGCVVGFGEILGGFGAPAIAGAVAETYSISYILWICTAATALGFVIALFLRETRTR